MATLIHDIALREGIDPDLAYRLVKIESAFNPRAVSSAGAIGLAQVMPATARFYDRSITTARLMDPETNLRIGFRYLRYLLDRFDWDLRLALLAYNRGPGRVGQLLARGEDPGNGYATSITRGYQPAGPALP
jgi:soluble lytic murein transglycosylase-like protein